MEIKDDFSIKIVKMVKIVEIYETCVFYWDIHEIIETFKHSNRSNNQTNNLLCEKLKWIWRVIRSFQRKFNKNPANITQN